MLLVVVSLCLTGWASEIGGNPLDTRIVDNINEAVKSMKENTIDKRGAKSAIVAAAVDAAMKDERLLTTFSKRVGVTWRFAKSALSHRSRIFDPDDEDHPWVITRR